VRHLVPALQSYWLIIHVSIAVLSSALFTLTFATSALQPVQTHRHSMPVRSNHVRSGDVKLAQAPATISSGSSVC
jgi:ABC-type transport system involved in cytochrome c biogenesis permease subunit